MTTKKRIKDLFRVEYRLSVLISGKFFSTYGTDRKLLKNIGNNTEGLTSWTLYKKGPLCLPEREIDRRDF